MPIMLSKTYAAFVAAGMPENGAREAAKEIADFKHRRTGIESSLWNIEGDIRLVKWMLGVVLACVAIPLVKSLIG